MKRLLVSSLCFALLAATARAAEPPSAQTLARPTDASAPLRSGIDMSLIEPSVRPQDDLSGYVNGRWFATTEIPADKPAYGAGSKIYDQTQVQLRDIVEKAQRERHASAGPAQRIGDLYKSFMDEARLETLDVKPLAAEFARIDALRGKHEIAAEIAHLGRIGVNTPYGLEVHQDNKDSTRYIVDLGQGGLGLPDRDYYLDDGDAKLSAARAKYGKHVGQMLAMAGDLNADRDAAAILALETELAKAQWTKVELRDPIKAYNKFELDKLGALAPGYDWKRYMDRAGITGKVGYLIVGQPSYITAFATILDRTPLPVWKTYFRWRLLSAYAPYLSQPYVDANFAFYGTVLNGTPEIRARWKRGIQLVDQSIGEDLGKVYVEQYFPPASKARMDALVGNLLVAYRQSIGGLDWMSAATKAKALEKLAKFTPKIGYPNNMARLFDAQNRFDRPGRQRDARQRIRISTQHRQARQTDRSRRMADDTADRQRLLQPGDERDRVSRGHPAAALLRRASRRRGQLRRDRRGDRPRDQPRLRRPGQPVRRRRQPAQLVDGRGSRKIRSQDQGLGRSSTTPMSRWPVTTSMAS